jgi:hypothetical protein
MTLAEEMCRGELPHCNEALNYQEHWACEGEKCLEQRLEGNMSTGIIALNVADEWERLYGCA